MKRNGAWIIVLLVLAVTGIPAAGHADIADGDFSDWTFTTSVWGGAEPGRDDGVATIINDSGNHLVNMTTYTYTYGKSVHVLGVKNDYAWDPAVQGGIGSVSMALDHRLVSHTTGSSFNHGVGMVIFQDSNFYYWGLGAYAGGNTSWETIDSALLPQGPFSQDDFVLIVPDIGTDNNVHPDFSPTGSPIKFGFSIGSHIARTLVHDYDNFALTVNAVPIPGAMMLLAAGLTLAAGLGRRLSH